MSSERKFKITVQSAEEAVHVLKKNFNNKARVISVQQIGGKGLARFLRKPRLEIIVVVPTEENLVKTNNNIAPVSEENIKDEHLSFSTADAPLGFNPHESSLKKYSLKDILSRSGFDPLLINEFLEIEPSWKEQNIQKNLHNFFEYLKELYGDTNQHAIESRIAFVGPSGVGKTLAMCKLLSQEVFINGNRPIVVKLDSNQAKGQEALNVFCDVLGIPFLQEGIDEIPQDESKIVFDCDGVDFNKYDEIQILCDKLNSLKISSRILTLNALYDTNFLDLCFAQSQQLQLTHCVFTHLDEVIGCNKLWKYILKGGLTPYFFSTGQNLTADFTAQILPYLLHKTYLQSNYS